MAKKILFLDDDLDLLKSYQEVITLMTQDQTILVSSVQQLRSHSELVLDCEVAFLDINLGNHTESGLDAANWLRNNGYKGRIIFLTGHALTHPLVAQACQTPDTQVCQKPIGIDTLLALIKGEKQ